jgi:hypothetical protein
MNKLILLVFCHLVGDYVLQNDFIQCVVKPLALAMGI